MHTAGKLTDNQWTDSGTTWPDG